MDEKPLTHYRKYKTTIDRCRKIFNEANKEKVKGYARKAYHNNPEYRLRKIQQSKDRNNRIKAEKLAREANLIVTE